MSSDILEITVELPITARQARALLAEPELYPRLFAGIGACEQVDTVDNLPLWRLRAGNYDDGIHVRTVTRFRHHSGDIDLRCPETGSLIMVRVTDYGDGCRVKLTGVGARRIHPAVTTIDKDTVTQWARDGLRRLADICSGAPTSVVTNSKDATVLHGIRVARQVLAAGMLPARPDVVTRQLAGLNRWGFNLAGGYAAGAAHTPDRIAIADRRGTRTFREVHARTTALAAALVAAGAEPGAAVGLLAGNHAGMVEAMVAAGKAGLDVVLLNSGLSARRIEDTVQHHRLRLVFVDEALEPLVRYLNVRQIRIDGTDGDCVETAIAAGHTHVGHPRPGRLIVLTSGTSGTPKGARRPAPKGFATVAAILSRIPLSGNEVMLIPAPLFHTWGLAALQISTGLRATVVLPDRFDAEECLRLVAEHRVTSMFVVPTMVQRILDLPTAIRARYDTRSLRVVASCGAPLAGATVMRFRNIFGDLLYNVYGSTEVSWATIADPADLAVSPTTAGRPPLGTKVAVLDEDRRPVPIGVTGRIFIGNHMLFDGYVNYAPPDEAGGLLDTGDLGWLDVSGRLCIAGRADEMIISGGENVFPRPVEEALSHLPQVSEVAVVGVPDREFGQRLAAFIVRREGFGLDADMIRRYVRNRLSRFSVPRDVVFVAHLPRSATGKVPTRLLPGLAAD